MSETPTRSDTRQTAGATAFDNFHNRRSGGIDLNARRARIDAQVRPVAGGAPSSEEADSWRVPGNIDASGVRTGGIETTRPPENQDNPNTGIFSRFREVVTGATGGIFRRRNRNTTPDNGGAGTPPPPRHPDAPPTQPTPPEEPDDENPPPNPAGPPPPKPQTPNPNASRRNERVGDPDSWRVPGQIGADGVRRETPQPNIPPPPNPEAAPDPRNWRERLRERVQSIKDNIWGKMLGARDSFVNMADEAARNVEDARDWAEAKWKSPLGKVLRKGTEDIINATAEGKKWGKGGLALEVGKLVSLYSLYKGQELAGKLWERKADIATGVVAGAALRTIFISVGWEAYIARAAAAGSFAGLRKGWSELETYDKPEGLKARANILARVQKLTPEQRSNIALKMATAAGLGFAGSFIGMEFMDKTGLADTLHNALGLNKAAGLLSGLGENLPSSESSGSGKAGVLDNTDSKPEPSIPGTKPSSGPEIVRPGSLPNEPDHDLSNPTVIRPGTTEAIPNQDIPNQPVTRPGISTEPKAGIAVPDNYDVPQVTTAEGPPYEAEGDNYFGQGIPAQETAPPSSEISANQPETPASQVEEAVKDLPPTMSLPPDSTPWAIAKELLIEANPDGNYTPADIMAVDKVLCQTNGVAIPEWGIEGKVLATRLPAGMNFEINDDVKNIVRQIASK